MPGSVWHVLTALNDAACQGLTILSPLASQLRLPDL